MGRWGCGVSSLERMARGRIVAVGLVVLFALAGPAVRSAAQTHTVVAGPAPVVENRPVHACWTAPAGASAFDWVVVAEVGSPVTSFLSFAYTGGATSGCASLYAYAAPGSTVEVRYLLDNGYDLAATSDAIAVIASPGFIGLNPTPTQVVPGRKVVACWYATPGIVSGSDVIGLFDSDAPLDPAVASAATGGTDDGCVSLVVPGSGAFEVRYLYGGTLDVAAAGIATISLPGTWDLQIAPSTTSVNRPVYACWSAPAGSSPYDWVILTETDQPNTQYVSWSYTGGSESGCVALSAGGPGTYEVRYLLDNGQTDTASSAPIEVVAPPGFASLSVTPGEVVDARDVHACWSVGSEGVASTDVVALFDLGQPLAPPLAVRGTCGAESGCAAFAHAWSGSYEVRYLSGGSLDIAGASLTAIPVAGTHGVTASLPSGPTGDVEACWTAPPGASAFDWVVLVAIDDPNTSYRSFSYTGGSASGCASLSNPALSGPYEVRYLLDNGQTDVASSNEVLLGSSGSTLHAYEWKVAVTGNPQAHPQFSVGGEVSLMSFVPRSAVDRLPGDPTIGDYATSAFWPGGFTGVWSLGGGTSAFSTFDDLAGEDGVQLAAARSGRSVTLDCATAPSLFDDDRLKTRDVPVPGLDCPNPANAVTIQDSAPAANVTGELVCAHYLPEPSLASAIAIGGLALAGGAARRRRSERAASPGR